MRLFLPYLLLLVTGLTACRKSQEITTDKNAKLSFSADTILFDTVFTAVGSASKRLKIYNTNTHAIVISNIELKGGDHSPFSLLINGLQINSLTDLQIGGNDSASVFIKVNINPNNSTQPFIVQDSILFSTNGNKQSVPLIAYGQNAVFINNRVINANTNWNSSLPYIIYKSVTVSAGATLNISEGTKVYFHGNSAMNIKGMLNVEGSKSDPVEFAGDRLEEMYEDEPGQWTGIHLYSGSSAARINYAEIKNAVIGIMVDQWTANPDPKLLLTNSIVKNMTVSGLTGYNTNIIAFNNLFFNCGQYLFYGTGGGRYNLKQNTFAGYNLNFARKTPALFFSDTNNGFWSNLQVGLINNIIWGPLTEELLIERKANSIVEADVRYNIIKTKLQIYPDNFLNADPMFLGAESNNFKIQYHSPAVNKGLNLSSDPWFNSYLNKDLDGNERLFPSEIGCYENN